MRETRTAVLTANVAEVRADEPGDALRFVGHAAVFNERTFIGPKPWGFYEEIDSGFFRNVLADDAAFLVNHDPNIVLARNGVSLALSVDERGLVTDATFDRADPEAVMWAGRVRRGDVTQMSFAFTIAEQKWSEDSETGEETRTLLTAERLYDVSLVTYPAYPGTDGAMRDAAAEVVLRHRGVDPRVERAEPRADEPATQPPADRDGASDGAVGPALHVLRHRLIAARHGLPR